MVQGQAVFTLGDSDPFNIFLRQPILKLQDFDISIGIDCSFHYIWFSGVGGRDC